MWSHAPKGARISLLAGIDHIALRAATKEAFEDFRRRLVDEGASDGAVTDFGSLLSVFFRDPDGMEAEVAYWKQDTAWR